MLFISVTDLIIVIISGIVGGVLGPIIVKKFKKLFHHKNEQKK